MKLDFKYVPRSILLGRKEIMSTARYLSTPLEFMAIAQIIYRLFTMSRVRLSFLSLVDRLEEVETEGDEKESESHGK